MLARIIDEYIREKNGEGIPSTENPKFRVSDAGKCHLMRYWKRKGIEPTDEPDVRAKRVFEVGHVFHNWLQAILRRNGCLVEEEFEVEDTHRKGHVDAIVMTPEGLILYDFKTVHSRKFNYLNNEIDKHYIHQIVTYYMMLPFGVEDIRLAYISKDDLRIQEMSIIREFEFEKILQETVDDWDKLIIAWETGQEPEPNPETWECRYCIYRSRCNPQEQKQETIQTVSVAELEDLLKRRKELEELALEYEEIDRQVKEQLKTIPLQNFSIGNFYIEKKMINKTVYEIPQEIKKQYAQTKQYEKIEIKELTGG